MPHINAIEDRLPRLPIKRQGGPRLTSDERLVILWQLYHQFQASRIARDTGIGLSTIRHYCRDVMADPELILDLPVIQRLRNGWVCLFCRAEYGVGVEYGEVARHVLAHVLPEERVAGYRPRERR